MHIERGELLFNLFILPLSHKAFWEPVQRKVED